MAAPAQPAQSQAGTDDTAEVRAAAAADTAPGAGVGDEADNAVDNAAAAEPADTVAHIETASLAVHAVAEYESLLSGRA